MAKYINYGEYRASASHYATPNPKELGNSPDARMYHEMMYPTQESGRIPATTKTKNGYFGLNGPVHVKNVHKVHED